MTCSSPSVAPSLFEAGWAGNPRFQLIAALESTILPEGVGALPLPNLTAVIFRSHNYVGLVPLSQRPDLYELNYGTIAAYVILTI